MATQQGANGNSLEARALALVEQSRSIAIVNASSYASAWDFLKRLKAMAKAWEEHNAPAVEATHKAWKAAVAGRDKLLKPFAEAERGVKALIGAYDEAEKGRAAREEKRLQDEAVLAEAGVAEAEGDHARADAILNGAEAVAPVILAPSVPKIEGGSVRKVWKARIVDYVAFYAGVKDGSVPMTLLKVDQSALDQLAKALQGGFNIPGAQAYTESVVSARA